MEHIATPEVVAGLTALLLIAAGVLALTERLHFPFSVGLLLVGIGLGVLADIGPQVFHPLAELQVSADLIMFVFLPSLIFESAIHLDWRQLRANLAPVLLLAVPGLLLSTGIIGGILTLATGMPLPPALLLGAILSATDPVAVIALFKRLGAPARLTVLVEGESLFNDATSIVVSRILIGIIAAGTLDFGTIGAGITDFVVVFFGGIIVGLVLAEMAAWALARVQSNPAIEITLTTVLAYLSFLVAEEAFHVSGVMATVAAGISHGNRGWMRVSVSVRHYLEHLWEYIGFVATALIFLMVGLSTDLTVLPAQLDVLIWLIAGMLVSRAAVIYGLIPLLNRIPNLVPVSTGFQAVMYWGGLRGAIALAIALSLPDDFAYKDDFVALVLGAVLFTLLVQGVTMDRLVRWLGLDKRALADRYGEIESQADAQKHALERLPQLSAGGMFSGAIAQRLHKRYSELLSQTEQQLRQIRQAEFDPETEESLIQLRALAEEREHLREMFDNGHLDQRPLQLLLGMNADHLDAVRHGNNLGLSRQAAPPGDWARRPRRLLENLAPGLARNARHARIAVAYQVAWGTYQTCSAVLQQLDRIIPANLHNPELRDVLSDRYEHWRSEARNYLDQTAEQFPEFVSAMQERHAKRLALLAESEALSTRYRHGVLDAGSAERLLHAREAELAALRAIAAEQLRTDPTELLRKVHLFAGMSQDEFAPLAKHMRERTFVVGEDILRQGDPGDSMYLIARGVVRVIVKADGGEHELATLLAGDYFGEMALLTRDPRTATVRAVTPCTTYELMHADFNKAQQAHPGIAAAVAKTAQQRRAELDADQATAESPDLQ